MWDRLERPKAGVRVSDGVGVLLRLDAGDCDRKPSLFGVEYEGSDARGVLLLLLVLSGVDAR